MARRKSFNAIPSAVGLLIAMSSAATDGQTVTVDSALDECLVVTIHKLREMGNMTLAESDVKERRSTAACGCKSGLVSYVVDGIEEDFRHESIAHGQYSAGEDREFTFLINPDNKVNAYTGYELHIGCMPPS